MKKLLLVVILVLALFSASACGTTGPGTISSGNSSGEKVNDEAGYLKAVSAPKYDEVDLFEYTDVYFDAENGDDANDGMTVAAPKKSLSEVNAAIKNKSLGALRILLKGTFQGVLDVSGYAATEKTPLIVASYGAEQAVIDGNGNENAVIVTGGNVRITDLEIINPRGLRGIYVYTTGAYKNVVISGCYIHNVNWNWKKADSEESYFGRLNELGVNGVKEVDSDFIYERGGIIFDTATGSTPCWLENVWVENNRIEKVSRSGVFMTSQWVRRIGVAWGVNPYCDDEHGYYPSKNVNYVGNKINLTGGDGLVMIGVRGGYFERNVSYHANFLGRSGTANVGMWPISSKDIIMQYNEAAYCHLANGGADGEGFDLDIGCVNVVFQYNYSHDNDGPGILLCNTSGKVTLYDQDGNALRDENGKIVTSSGKAEWSGAYIRNNVFANNGKRDGNYPTLMHLAGPCENVYVENNTIIFTDNPNQPLMTVTRVKTEYDSSLSNNFYFRNNIFYSEVQNNGYLKFTAMCEDYIFLSNVYYNMSDSFIEVANDSKSFTFDPEFDLPTEKDGFAVSAEYAPTNDQCYASALTLKDKNLFDIAGNKTVNVKYFGAIAENW